MAIGSCGHAVDGTRRLTIRPRPRVFAIALSRSFSSNNAIQISHAESNNSRRIRRICCKAQDSGA